MGECFIHFLWITFMNYWEATTTAKIVLDLYQWPQKIYSSEFYCMQSILIEEKPTAQIYYKKPFQNSP